MSKYDVYTPLSVTTTRPSAVQERLLSEMTEGGLLVGRFDVWGGYDWFLRRENGMTSSVDRRTVQGLLDRGLITKGDAIRVVSGRQEIPFTTAARE